MRVIPHIEAPRIGLGVPALVQLRGKEADNAEFLEEVQARADVRFLSGVIGEPKSLAEFVVPSFASLQKRLRELSERYDISAEPFFETHIYTWSDEWHLEPVGRNLRPEPTSNTVRNLSTGEIHLLELLMRDGRAQISDLAVAIGKSENTARRMLDSLKAEGVLDFRLLVEPRNLGFNMEFMMWLDVEVGKLTEIAHELALSPGTKFLTALAGRYALAGQIVLREQPELHGYITRTVGDLDGVRRVEPTIQTTVYKRAWHAITDGSYVTDSYAGPSAAEMTHAISCTNRP